MKENIFCSSLTGNTMLLANVIDSLDLNNDVLYVGFWTDKGMADPKTLKYLESLRNKKIFLFGTCGFGLDNEYFEKIANRTIEHIDSSNEVVGHFVCVGKMRQAVRDRYVNSEFPNKEMMIKNFDLASTHPDENDFNKLKKCLLDNPITNQK